MPRKTLVWKEMPQRSKMNAKILITIYDVKEDAMMQAKYLEGCCWCNKSNLSKD